MWFRMKNQIRTTIFLRLLVMVGELCLTGGWGPLWCCPCPILCGNQMIWRKQGYIDGVISCLHLSFKYFDHYEVSVLSMNLQLSRHCLFWFCLKFFFFLPHANASSLALSTKYSKELSLAFPLCRQNAATPYKANACIGRHGQKPHPTYWQLPLADFHDLAGLLTSKHRIQWSE